MTLDTSAPSGTTSASVIPPTEADVARPAIVIDNVSKVFGHTGDAVHALDGVNLDVARGEFVCLLGASGCGKSTLLNIIAGLDGPTVGRVDVGEARTTLMFQEAALFPWLTARGNVELPLKFAKVGKAERRDKADELLRLVNLGSFGDKRPHELSGGMQQRVALARALALDPAVLLMDEPFAALDEITRDRMAFELMRLWHHYRKTVLFVTHSLAEAVFLSDRVVLMSARPGRIHQVLEIDLPRPRDRETRLTDRFHQIVSELNRELYRVMA